MATDYLLRFKDHKAAETDALLGKYWVHVPPPDDYRHWTGPVTPEPMIVETIVTENGKPVLKRHDGCWMMIAGYEEDAALAAHPALQIVLRRQGDTFVIVSSKIDTRGLDIAPLPQGMRLAPAAA